MADNIKIIGEILNTQQISRYDNADLNLLSPQLLREDFGQQNDYIEYFVYDAGDNLLNINYSYKDFKSPSTSYVNPTKGTLPIIEIDPVKDLQNLNYSSGEFKVQYNLFNNQVSNPSAELFLKEISSDRTEIRVGSTILTNDEIENAALSLINTYTGSAYFVDYLINFGNNEQVVAVNVALNKVDSGYEILFKLYHPLPDVIEEKSTLWVVKEKVNPYIFDINLDKLITPAPGPQLRGPNFDIDIPNQNNIATSYQNYNGLVNSLQNVSSSYQQLLSLITSQSIDINTDYTDFNNFVFFSSAKQRVINFYNKVKEIEDYTSNIAVYIPLTSSRPNLITDYNNATSSINNIIANFDGYEYYLYFESSSYAWPKTNQTLPYILASITSVTTWYNNLTASADLYDDSNQNNLIYTVPTFIKDDDNNTPYFTFLNMVGHYFDNIWIYLDAITYINLANNNLEKGVSKDLVYIVLQSLGTKLYNKYGDSETNLFLVGQDSGSANFDNNFTPTGSYLNNIPRKDLLAETYKRIYHNLPLLLKTKGTTYGLQTLISTFGITSSILNVKEYGGDLKANMLDEYNNDKIRIVTNSIASGSILSPFVNLQSNPTIPQLRTTDYHYVDVSFSPETQIDTYASASIAIAEPNWSLDNIIGDPGYLYSGSYNELDIDRNTYYNFNPSYMDYAGFIRLIQFFDNSLFKMLKDFVPARANLSTGITINSPVLERNKFVYANPSSTSKIEVNEGTIEGPTIGTEYTDIYQHLTGSRVAYYTGEFEGDVVDYSDIFDEVNFNPYLLPTSSIDLNIFAHSDFNVLFNNVSSSRLSINRRLLQPIYIMNSPISLAGYSSSYFAELQDSYETLKTHQLSRYEGVKISSLKYNNYTSASTTYGGDISFGKEPTINKNTRKLGLFTEIVSSSFLPGRNRISLKYLVDDKGGLTELNQRNKHWEEVQRTFIAGDYLNISQFDNQKYGNQKNTDGDKLIYDSGYAYYPILYFASCSVGGDPKIYFENLGESNSYQIEAINGTSPLTISGSGIIGYPITSNNVLNIFNTEILDASNIFTPGITSAPPTYSVQESGDYRVQASFILNANVVGTSTYLTGSLILLKNGTEILRDTHNLDLVADPAINTGSLITGFYSNPGGNANLTYTNFIFTGRSLRFGATSYPAGTKLYRYTTQVFGSVNSGDPNNCTVSSPQSTPFYLVSNVDPSPFPATSLGCINGIVQYNTGASNFYSIYDPEAADVSSDSATFNINRPTTFPISGLTAGDKLSLIFNTSASNSNFTASLTEGSLVISSLSTATGYASTLCPYFSSSSISASIANGDKNIITFSPGLSNFHDRNYQFIPNPLTGSINSLYSGSANYGDIDYPFSIKPYDILITYLSDNTYVESRVLSSSISASLLQLYLDKQMSNLYSSNLQSGSYQRFLILKRVEDETNAHLVFRKRPGKTSYGFTIPSNIATNFLDNIDTITKEVKQKLLADQQGTTT